MTGFRYVVLSVAFSLILNACLKPVNLKAFLDDDKIIEIIEREADVIIDIEVDIDKPPEVGSEITISLSINGTLYPTHATITVTNADNYDDGSIKWYCNDTAPIHTGEEFIIDTANPPFDAVGRHILTIEAQIDSEPYSTYIYIDVRQ